MTFLQALLPCYVEAVRAMIIICSNERLSFCLSVYFRICRDHKAGVHKAAQNFSGTLFKHQEKEKK